MGRKTLLPLLKKMTKNHELFLPLTAHLEQLRWACIRAFIALFLLFTLFLLFSIPLYTLWVHNVVTSHAIEAHLFSPLDPLFLAVKTAFFSSLPFSLLYCGAEVLFFILPGLLPGEKHFFKSLFTGIFLIPLPALATVWFFSPYLFSLLVAWAEPFGKVSWGANLVFDLVLALWLGIAFVLAIFYFLIVAIHYHVLSYTTLKKQRKKAFLISFVLGAISTPPDIFSQILAAFPIYLLFELALLFAAYKQRQLDTFSTQKQPLE